MSLATYNSTQASDFYFCVDTKLNCFDSSLLESIQKHYDMKTEENIEDKKDDKLRRFADKKGIKKKGGKQEDKLNIKAKI
ncbi:hypothetical protein OnM2_021020 [Erysiphe neolycopersici]|uniref:Uncharacterized protein n=1 Tax=Erysiphe neolycopersici TaxID=212602 RepID=A0A420I2T3_9PEZI|nr:hypothetical protein OnM2_021020 [Erysiphe neolycopersici]